MGSHISSAAAISETGLKLVLLPVPDAIANVISWLCTVVDVFDRHVTSWLYTVVVVVDKCFDSMPGGAAGGLHGDLAEANFTLNGSDATLRLSVGSKIRDSLRLVEMGSVHNARVSSPVDGTDDHVCAVCLGEITEEELVYLLPQCDHIFHSACLDRWVSHNHDTCPLCRTSLIAGPGCSPYTETGTLMQDGQEMFQAEDPGFSFGIWFVSQFATNVNFNGPGWTHDVMRLVGF